MNRLNNQVLRRLIFSLYVLLTILFCLLLYHMGSKEIEKARSYSEKEGLHVESLHRCLDRLNKLSSATAALALRRDQASAAVAEGAAKELRKSISELVPASAGRGEDTDKLLKAIQAAAKTAHSSALAALSDLGSPEPERAQLLAEDAEAIAEAEASSAASLQTLLRKEIDNVGIWQRQSLYFFGRLQYLVVVFFISATAFSLLASFAFSAMLKASLKRLSEGTRELRDGKLDYRFDEIQPDEIGAVMLDFNSMARRIESQSKALMKANVELKDKAEQLIEAHHHKDRFLANMSHELRTPLNSVIGFADLIIQRAGSSGQDKIKGNATRILSAAEHLLELISGLLEVAKFDAGVLKPVFNDFDLAFCAEETCAMLRPLAEKKGLVLKAELPPALPVRADRRMIRQAMINLIGNAIKFTAKGHVAVRLRQEGGSAVIEVEDSGIGIPDSEKANIFKDFHRVETGLTSNYEGVGIGLALSRRLVELHGGEIIFASSLGNGSVFTVKMPGTQKTKDGK